MRAWVLVQMELVRAISHMSVVLKNEIEEMNNLATKGSEICFSSTHNSE